jgi:hypothetical protein
MFFFKPFEIDAETADLLEEFGEAEFVLGIDGLGSISEDVESVLQEKFLPGVNEVGVDAVLSGEFIGGAVAAECGESDLGLEGR